MEQHLQRNQALLTPVAILIGSVIIAGAIVTGARGIAREAAFAAAGDNAAKGQGTAKAAPALSPDSAKVNAKGEAYIGNPQAAVTVAYWYDYQCPFCKKVDEAGIAQIVDEYVASGKVKLLFKDFQFLGADSQALGLMARAVWEAAPDKFYAWHKAVFAAQGRENSGWATKEAIRTITVGALGAEAAGRAAALAEEKATAYAQALEASRTEGGRYGIRSTPSMMIGKKLIVGAQPYEQLKAAVDAALAGK